MILNKKNRISENCDLKSDHYGFRHFGFTSENSDFRKVGFEFRKFGFTGSS